jgi:two-component system, response regulator YesN
MQTNKIKIMFVDDEEKTRSLLQMVLDWDSLGFEVVGEASSGMEGLSLMDELAPDLIITDIRMPFMDGLEFAGLVVESYPNTKVIVLTAYEEFEYAKQGIKMGISDFLLKPIKRSEIKESVEIIRSKILNEQSNREEYNRIRQKLKESLPFLRDKFLNELLVSKILPIDIKERIEYYSLPMLKNYAQIAVVSIGKETNKLDQETTVVQELLYIDTIKQYFKSDLGVIVFADNNGKIVILNSQEEINLYECCEYIKILIINKLKCDINIGVGNSYNELNKLQQSYREAAEALNYKLIYGNNIVIRYSDISLEKDKNTSIYGKNDDMDEILFYIRAGISEKANELIRNKFKEISSYMPANSNEIRVIGISIITAIINTLSEFDLNLSDIFSSISDIYSDILSLTNIPEIEAYIINISDKLTTNIKNIRETKKNSLMDDIIRYVEDNISDSELTLSALAAHFYINPSYLSRTFKQHTSFTFVEYLTSMRIKKAIGYFNNYDNLVYEVAEKVGIPDPNYFGKCFKKYTGYSINDYKKQKS